jgi:hypothetical protein
MERLLVRPPVEEEAALRVRPMHGRVPVPAGLFASDREPPFPLFTAGGSEAYVDPRWLDRMAGQSVYLSPRDLPLLYAYLRRHLVTILRTLGTTPGDRAWAVHRALLLETATLMHGGGRASMAGLHATARELALLVAREYAPFAALDTVIGGPYAAATHAVDTAVVSTVLAAADGARTEEDLTAVALAGLFADFGKLDVAGGLARPGPLTHEEWRLMQSHPHRSVQRMRQSGLVVARALHGALSHHERWDGEGYPERRRGPRIPVEARYLAIADAYTAMTADRPYRRRLSAFEAISEMASADGQFEPRLLRLFVPLFREISVAA